MVDERAGSGKMLRAMNDDAGSRILAALERGRDYEDPLRGDPSVFAIEDWEAEATFREQLLWTPEIAGNAIFQHYYKTHREIGMMSYVRERSDQLTRTALMISGQHREEVLQEHDDPGGRALRRITDEGADHAGNLVEVLGISGSGKSEMLAWWAIRSLEAGIPVCANFWLKVPDEIEPIFAECHRATEAVAWMAEMRIELDRIGKSQVPIWFLRDEAGVGLGGSSQGTTTLEGRWENATLAKMRHIGVNAARARQADNIPPKQLEWVTLRIRLNRAELGVMRGEYLGGVHKGETFAIRADRMNDRYDTHKSCSFDGDLDMELLDRYTARYEKTEAIAVTWARYANAAADGRDLFEEEFGDGDSSRPKVTVLCKRCDAEFSYGGARRSEPGKKPLHARHPGCGGYADLPVGERSPETP